MELTKESKFKLIWLLYIVAIFSYIIKYIFCDVHIVISIFSDITIFVVTIILTNSYSKTRTRIEIEKELTNTAKTALDRIETRMNDIESLVDYIRENSHIDDEHTKTLHHMINSILRSEIDSKKTWYQVLPKLENKYNNDVKIENPSTPIDTTSLDSLVEDV